METQLLCRDKWPGECRILFPGFENGLFLSRRVLERVTVNQRDEKDVPKCSEIKKGGLNKMHAGNYMKKCNLPKLEDYVFLSDLESDEVFIIQRSGEVWKQDGTEPWDVPGRLFKNVIFDWKNMISGECCWSWLNGWLPVLQIKNNSGQKILLLAKNDSLWLQTAGAVISYPEGINITAEKFDAETQQLEKYWNKWLASGWMPPPVHPYIDDGWKASLVQARMAYSGKHPHYGVAFYGKFEHDGFPPTTLAMVSTLLDYDHIDYARELLSYYLERYVLPDGVPDYYGVSVAELGGLLILSARMLEYNDGQAWLEAHLSGLMSIFRYLLRLHNPVISRLEQGLIIGSPEADTRRDVGAFFHNNAFVWRAFEQWSRAMVVLGRQETEMEARRHARELKASIETATNLYRGNDGLIPSRIDKKENFNSFTESREAAYANYRYYPELLESGILSADDAYSIIKAREEKNGEVCGMTHMGYDNKEHHFDNWPLASYARGLIELEDKQRFMNIFISHILHHQSRDTFTAYEQVTASGDPRRAYADWCVPCQLVLPRMLAWSFKYKKWNGSPVTWGGPEITGLEV